MTKSENKLNEIENLFNLVKDRYGGRLSSEELKEVRREVEVIVDTAIALRSVKLKNSDEPFSVFAPY